MPTHPNKRHSCADTSSLSHSHPHRRERLGVQSFPPGLGPGLGQHRGPQSQKRTVGVCEYRLYSGPDWHHNLPWVWISPCLLRSRAGWPGLFQCYLKNLGRSDNVREHELTTNTVSQWSSTATGRPVLPYRWMMVNNENNMTLSKWFKLWTLSLTPTVAQQQMTHGPVTIRRPGAGGHLTSRL